MKKILIAAASVILTASASLAENPNVGEPADLYANERAPIATQLVDQTATTSIDQSVFHDGSAHRFGDASPSSISAPLTRSLVK